MLAVIKTSGKILRKTHFDFVTAVVPDGCCTYCLPGNYACQSQGGLRKPKTNQQQNPQKEGSRMKLAFPRFNSTLPKLALAASAVALVDSQAVAQRPLGI